jgi:hypothetical protein
MNEPPPPEANPSVDDQDVEGHSLLIEAQGRELHDRRSQETAAWGMAQRARPTKTRRPGRLRRLLGG